MTFRYTPLRATQRVRTDLSSHRVPFQQQQWRGFRPSGALRDDQNNDTELNHYETLNVHPDASPAEIKKSFYSLSKTHHPDHNPGNPHAPKHFMRISEAYSVLSHAEKRARYDRDVMRRRHNHPTQHRSGSYHSTGPAGGRPASGLSRRRGTFTGPPPSFYRSGGWGNQSAKRKAAHEGSTGGVGGDTGGMGPGADPLHRTRQTPGFDSQRHEAQHTRITQERMARRGRMVDIPIGDAGLLFRFAVVAGIISFVAYIPYWFMAAGEGRKGKTKKADASG